MRFSAQDVAGLRLQVSREFDRLNQPGRPMGVFACTTAERPAAADYPYCLIFDVTLGALKTSDGTNWV